MSSGSESDEEYVPGEPEQLSEEGSADEETDLQFEKELEQKTLKRKAGGANTKNKRRRTANKSDEQDKKELDELPQVNPEEEKKKEDDLWAMFLEGTDTKPKSKEAETNTTSKTTKPIADNSKRITTTNNVKKPDEAKEKEKRIFEFAGETVVVEDNVIKETIKSTQDNSAIANFFGGPSKPKKGGLSSVLGALNSKNKLSTLEKSKLDWETYKKKEGIDEEVKSFNKGKGGYLERQDFLQRSDVRQYELEREARLNRRSNR